MICNGISNLFDSVLLIRYNAFKAAYRLQLVKCEAEACVLNGYQLSISQKS